MFNWTQARLLTWPLWNIPLLCFKRKVWFAFEVYLSLLLSICIVKLCLLGFRSFGWIWADNTALYTSEFTLLLLLALTISKKPDRRGAIYAHIIRSGSWAVPSLPYTQHFPSIWFIVQSYRAFGLPELTSSFFLTKEPNSWFGHILGFCYISDGISLNILTMRIVRSLLPPNPIDKRLDILSLM